MATGYVITRNGSRISVLIPDLIEIDHENRSMSGRETTAIGVDLQTAYFFATDEQLDIEAGDVFPDGQKDVSEKYIKKDTQKETQNDMAALLIECTAQKQKIASLESMVGNLLVDIATQKGGN